MNPCALTFGVTILANKIAESLSDDELAIASAVFSQLGDTLATIAAQRAVCTDRKNQKLQ